MVKNRWGMKLHWTDHWVHKSATKREIERFRKTCDSGTSSEGINLKCFSKALKMVAEWAKLKDADKEAAGGLTNND
jgi:hypothetical protein